MRPRRSETAAREWRSHARRSRWQATVNSKGQVTVPKPIRDRLLLKSGDRIDFVVEADGSLRIVAPTVPVTALKGLLPKPPVPVTLREMNKAVITAVARRSGSS